jgi:type I restriction enzyme S subunit
MNEIMVGSTQVHITNIAFKSAKLAFPKLEEQRLIAQALSDIDALITALDKLIAKKRHIKTATMQQLLTGKKRLPGFGEGKGYKKTDIGVIPEDWDYFALENFITEFRGGAPLKPSDFTNAGVKVLPKGGVVRGGILKIYEKDLQFCSNKYAEQYSKNTVDNTYIIVVLRDLVPSGPSIGLIVQIGKRENYLLAQGVYGFKTTGIIEGYLIQYSNSFPYRRLMNEIMVGSTQVHITNTTFKSVKLPFPKLEEQRAIAQVLSDIDTEITNLEKRRAKTQAIKQGMMQELLTGRTRLSFDKA